jgi:hypothetical protein
MTRRASFGDFAADATQHLQQLRWLRRPSDVTDRAIARDVVADLSRAVHPLVGFAEDACRALDAEYLAGDRQLGVWIRAATQAREALAAAETALSATNGLENGASADRRRRGSVHLRAAARSMTLGRDLLHTHDAIHGGHMTVAGSEWTPVISSAPVACAILHETGGWARQIAGYAYPLSATASCPVPEGRTLSTVGKALSQVTWAIGEAQERRPVRREHVTLLHTIPVNTSPAARLPTGLESVADLEAGVISTAERLRFAARHVPPEAPWSRPLTRETLRQTAGCCAVSASNMRIMLRTLAVQHSRPRAELRASLTKAAEAVDRSRAAWLAVTESWNSITTDTRGSMGPAGTEAAALALWTGRLVYANPDWTPSLGPQHVPRLSDELALDIDGLREALDAAHHVAYTLTCVADADGDTARIASMAGRLIVPTRSLPDEYDVPYRFSPAPPSSADPLLSSYQQALQASQEATAATSTLAAEVRADSRVLTTARAAACRSPSAWAGRPLHPASAELGRDRHGAAITAAQHPQLLPPGPVERILIELDVRSTSDLEQAAAIDRAADKLILRATTRPKPSEPNRDRGRPAGSAELAERALATSTRRVSSASRARHPSLQAEAEAGV